MEDEELPGAGSGAAEGMSWLREVAGNARMVVGMNVFVCYFECCFVLGLLEVGFCWGLK